MSINIKKDSTTVATVDIGSNSIRMVIADIVNGRIEKTLLKERRTTRLAKGITVDNYLSQDSIDNSIKVLTEYDDIIKRYKVSQVGYFATSAIREANNSDIFINKAKSLGIDINVISGEKEAYFTYLGVASVIDIVNNAMIFDIGGGSTEFIVAKDNDIVSTDSYKIGVVKLVDIFNIKDDNRNDILACDKYINEFISGNVKCDSKLDTLIATAGTATTIASIHQKLTDYSSERINNYTLDREYIERLFHLIINTPIKDRSKIVGLEEGRKDLIIPGISIMLAVMKRLGFNKLKVADYGLREGVAIYLGSLT